MYTWDSLTEVQSDFLMQPIIVPRQLLKAAGDANIGIVFMVLKGIRIKPKTKVDINELVHLTALPEDVVWQSLGRLVRMGWIQYQEPRAGHLTVTFAWEMEADE